MITLERQLPERFQFRPGTCDANVFHDVVERNEYRLPDVLPADGLIVDVGAHIGSFTEACLRRGARRIVACEPDAENFGIFRRHFQPEIACGWVIPLPVAVLGQAPTGGLASLSAYEVRATELNTGGARLCAEDAGRWVPAVSLRAVLEKGLRPASDRRLAHPPVRHVEYLKLDCEGAEWEILATLGSGGLRAVRRLCGEFHPHNGLDAVTMQAWLTNFGFEARVEPQGEAGLGLFWGARKEDDL